MCKRSVCRIWPQSTCVCKIEIVVVVIHVLPPSKKKNGGVEISLI